MRTCVIFNPSARGEKARRFRRHLDEIAAHSTLKQTSGPGDARRLAAAAVGDNYEVVVAAGGDGTVNEVLNGLANAPGGLTQSCLGVLPLGTVNVFARELQMPSQFEAAWAVLRRARQTQIDLPAVEFMTPAGPERRVFAQLAGAGLDARAVELVEWPLKKKIGSLAYVWAGLKAMQDPAARITAQADGQSLAGGLVLVGNGRLYGGSYRIFEKADLRDGLLEICVFPRADWLTLAWCAPSLLIRGTLPRSAARMLQARTLTLTSSSPTPIEIDGELAGHLPASFSIRPQALRVVIP